MDIIIIDGLSFALPLFIMAIGGIYCEKSGVTMLAVEGLQGFGAFTGALVAVLISGFFSGNTPIPFYIAMLFAAVGGAGALLSKCIKKAEVIAYEDLGTEAIRKLEVENLPVIVVIDQEGRNQYEIAVEEWQKEI